MIQLRFCMPAVQKLPIVCTTVGLHCSWGSKKRNIFYCTLKAVLMHELSKVNVKVLMQLKT